MNNYVKRFHQRGLALFLALIMCLSFLPATAMAYEWEEATHICNENGWICTDAVVCSKSEHTHGDGNCVYADCPMEEHTHDENCVSEDDGSYICGVEEHSHFNDMLACTLEEHTHIEGVCCSEATHIRPSDAVVSFLRAMKQIPGMVTVDDEAAITAARAACNELSGSDLSNYAVADALNALVMAEAALQDALDAANDSNVPEDTDVPEDDGGEIPEEDPDAIPEMWRADIEAFLTAVGTLPAAADVTEENASELEELLYSDVLSNGRALVENNSGEPWATREDIQNACQKYDDVLMAVVDALDAEVSLFGGLNVINGSVTVTTAEELFEALYTTENPELNVVLGEDIMVDGNRIPEDAPEGSRVSFPYYAYNEDRTGASNMEGGRIWVNGTKTLNLNAHSLTRTNSGYDNILLNGIPGESSSFNNILYVPSGAVLTITGGGIIQFEGAGNNIIHVDGGNLTLENVTLQGGGANNRSRGIWVSSGSVQMNEGATITNFYRNLNETAGGTTQGWQAGAGVYLDGGTMTMNGGTITQNYVEGSGTGGAGVFVANSAELTVKRGTISKNKTPEKGGGVYVDRGGTLYINTNGTVAISDCTAANGGGVYVANGGSFTLDGTAKVNNTGVVCWNKAENGGGVYVDGGGQFTIRGEGSIDNCVASESGGGVYVANQGNFRMMSGAITQNSAQVAGGGVYIDGGSFIKDTARGGISGSRAPNGAGIYVKSGDVTIWKYAGITGNHASVNGGGIYVDSGATANLHSQNDGIWNNRADELGGGIYIAPGGTVTVDHESGNGDLRGMEIVQNRAKQGAGVYNAGIFTVKDGTITYVDNNCATDAGDDIYSIGTLNLTKPTDSVLNMGGIWEQWCKVSYTVNAKGERVDIHHNVTDWYYDGEGDSTGEIDRWDAHGIRNGNVDIYANVVDPSGYNTTSAVALKAAHPGCTYVVEYYTKESEDAELVVATSDKFNPEYALVTKNSDKWIPEEDMTFAVADTSSDATLTFPTKTSDDKYVYEKTAVRTEETGDKSGEIKVFYENQKDAATDVNGTQVAGRTVIKVYYVKNTVDFAYTVVNRGGTTNANTVQIDGDTATSGTAEEKDVPKTGNPKSVTATAGDGWEFKGWYTDANCNGEPTGIVKGNENEVWGTNANPTHFYALFEQIEYTVTYDPGEHGDFTAEKHEKLHYDDATPDFTGETTGKNGWSFTGWAPEVAEKVTEDAVYVAQWEQIEYTVTYDPGEHGDFTAEKHEKLHYDDATPDFTGETTGKNGWSFTGWAPEVAEKVTEDAVYVAQWEQIEYTVTYKPGEHGTFNDDVHTGLHYGDETPAGPSNPSGEAGWRFKGWEPSVEETVTGNAEYVAQWEYIPTYVPPISSVTPPTTTPSTPVPTTPTPSTTIDDDEVPLANTVGLNDAEHFAYIIGYDDDTVRPLNNITRAEAVTIFFRLMTDEHRAANWSTENSFSDVNVGNWFNNAVSTVQKAGALEHFAQDDAFLPNQAITRAEFASIAAGFVSDEITGENVGDFKDTEGHWAAEAIRKAVEAGWITGVGGNRFDPDATITRAEVMTMINRMLDRTPDKDHMLPTMKVWTDNPESAWYYEAVQEATNEHDYERDEMSVETWTELLTVRDWQALETEWANNGGITVSKTDSAERWSSQMPDGI